jgi:tRNA-splicing endonuclease subunit Sen34
MTTAALDIRIYVSNGNGFIFTSEGSRLQSSGCSPGVLTPAFSEEVYTLRAKYNITGSLIGTLPSASQQNVFLGLPLLLLPEEVVLLVSKGASDLPLPWLVRMFWWLLVGVALLVDDIAAHDVLPSLDRLTKWHESSRVDIQATAGTDGAGVGKLSIATKGKAKSARALRPEVIASKRVEREARRAANTAAAAAPPSAVTPQTCLNGDSTDDLTSSAEILLFAPDQSSSSIDTATERASLSQPPVVVKAPSSSIVKAHSVTVATNSSVLPWYPTSDKSSAFAAASPITASLLQHQHEYKTLEAARQAGLWTYPSTQGERARCAVFRDLHEKGYWMGGGLKFGGDWLIYPGRSFLSSEKAGKVRGGIGPLINYVLSCRR